ncbi:uncharacterized protein LOC135345075 [Halichondria panicea]|uniref:uncharacterized protein LOC135345075 n=1 Tax=Halichondria panicea TaxID=6063 RepID=UPI00312B698C
MSSDPSPPVPPPPMETPSEPDADENISHPSLELYRHTILRGANMGSFLALVVGPPVLFFRGVRSPAEMMRRMAGICAKGMGIGMVFAAVMTMMRTRGNTEEQVFDRSYRLRYNKRQVRLDKFSYGFALIGGAAGAAGLGGLGGVVGGASMGLGLSVIGHSLTGRSSEEEK